MRKITLFLLLFSAILTYGQTTTINFDDDANWIPSPDGGITSYQDNHVYAEGVFSATAVDALRQGNGDQDGFPGALGEFSWRLRNNNLTSWTATIASGGVDVFSVAVRRWDNSPSPNFNLEYSINGGENWVFVDLIDNASLNEASDWVTFSGTIQSDADDILVRIIPNASGERIMVDDFAWSGFSASPTIPTTVAPTPAEDEANVISLFSDAYTDITVDTWLTPWSAAQQADVLVDGNDVKLYSNLDFAGIETVANPIDASEMDTFHMDVWSPDATTFRVKLVDLGAGPVEGEIAFNIPQGEWVSLDIPLEDFANPDLVTGPLLTVRNSIQQLIISGLPVGAVTAYVDNIYFCQEPAAGDCGVTGTYDYTNGSSLENSIQSFTADNPGDFITLNFAVGSTESCCDDWFINNAADGTGVTIASGSGSIVGEYTSTTGEISFYVESDGSVTGTTFEYSVSCSAAPDCVAPFNLSSVSAGVDTIDIEWIGSDSANDYEVIYSDVVGFDPLTAGESFVVAGTESSATIENLTENTAYEVYVVSLCNDNEEAISELLSAQTVIAGATCEAAIEISALPYNTVDSTSNYGDNYSGAPGSDCGSTFSYLNGDDVVYSYTAANDGTLLVSLTELSETYAGIFVYESCEDIGEACVGADTNGFSSEDLELLLNVVSGQEYIFVISTWASPQSTDYTLNIDELLCSPVTDLALDTVNSDSASFNWSAASGESGGYEYILMLAGEEPGVDDSVQEDVTAAGATSLSFTSLDSNTSYDLYLRTLCSGSESDYVDVSFTTNCEVASLNYAEDFEDFLNPCWQQATGTAAGPDSFGFSSWSGEASPQFGSQAARYNMYTNTTAQWMLSQTIDLGAGSPDNVMNFDIAATVWNSTAATTFGPEDEVAAMISTDGGATWVELISFSAGSTPSNTGQNESIDLSSYSGEVQFGFYAISSPETSSDHWVYIDNFYVGTPPPTIVSVGNPALDSYCYDDSEFEEWRFDSDDGSALVIVFEAGSVESSFSGTWDDLIIYDGVDNTGTVLFNSDVDGNELTGLSFTAQSGSIYMTLDSDGSVSCQSSPNIETIEFGVYVEGDEPQPAFANVQVIHNSPDPAAASVDVYLNGALLPALTGVDFRTATSFLEAPAGVDIVVDVVPAGADLSTSVFTETFNLAEDENYIIVANGVLDTSGFVTDNAFELTVYAGAQTAALDPAQVDVLVHHGSPDAPAVDVNESTAGNLVSNIAYPEFQGYLNLAVADYTLEIAAAGTPEALVAYSAPLATLGGFEGAAITVVASGFLGDDASMDNGFGLWVATAAGGALVELPLVEQEPAPMDPAPTPTEAEADVISLFSEAYTDVSVDTWLTPWSSANLEDIQIQGNDTKLYTNLDFAGIETVANPIDATDMDFFHIDVWSPNATTFRVKLVDLGNGATEGELAFDIAQEEWVSLQIPLADFADATLVTDPNNLLTVRNSIQQLIISGLPVGDVTAYVDNVYFSSDAVVSTIDFDSANFSYYPNPVKTSITIDATNNVEEIEVFNMLGQRVITQRPNQTNPRLEMGNLEAGVYLMKVSINGASKTFQVIKE